LLPALGAVLTLGVSDSALAQFPATPAQKAQALLAPETGRLPAEKRYLPASISEPLMSMRIQVVQETPAACFYRS
jgi:hypothetical protein